MTNKIIGAILLSKSGKTMTEIHIRRYDTMLIYDKLNDMDECIEDLGINVLSYVVLNCAR